LTDRDYNGKKISVMAFSGFGWNDDDELLYLLKLKPEIIAKLEHNFIKQLDKPYLSVHFRNTDIQNDVNDFIQKIKDTVGQYKTKDIFLATDDYTAPQMMNQHIDCNIHSYTELEQKKVINIHESNSSINKEKQFFDCLNDVYHIFRSNYFIPSSNSGLSKFIIAMIKNKTNIFNLTNYPIIVEI